jgi:hypothetical protein
MWSAVLDTPLRGRAGLLLLGGLDRYAALVTPLDGGPMTLEWALGDKKGVLLGPPPPRATELKLALRINRDGELTAHYGTLEAQALTPLGEPIQLGGDWKSFFRKAPTPAVGCIEALCTFTRVRYEVDRALQPALANLPVESAVELGPPTPAVGAPSKRAPVPAKKTTRASVRRWPRSPSSR